MEVRVALALCLVLCSALCGKALAGSAHRRAAALRELIEATKRLRVRMTGMFEPIQGALEHAECPIFSLVAGEMADGRSAGEAWERVRCPASRRGGPLESLHESDREVLGRLFEGLGQSGREEQELLLVRALEAVGALGESAQKQAVEAEKLYGPLGLLIGLMLALIVI